VDPRTRRFFKNATILWCVVPFIAFIAAGPVGPFCLPGEQGQGLYWYRAFALGADLSFLICFSSVILSRIALGLGYERTARGFMFMPLIGLGAYVLIVLGQRAYWGDAISCPLTLNLVPV
jgi:hypothetical protein